MHQHAERRVLETKVVAGLCGCPRSPL